MSPALPITSHAQLVQSIENLYRGFSAQTPPVIQGCPCCINTRNVDVLLSTPLRELSGDQLWRYITGAYLTVGGDRDFRYLLPRIFELAALSSFEVPDTEIVLGKLAHARWENWQGNEKEAVISYIAKWFAVSLEQDLLQSEEGWIDGQTDSLLCGIARAGLPIDKWLTRLTEPDHAPILADLRKRRPQDFSPFWEEVPDSFAKLMTFLADGSA